MKPTVFAFAFGSILIAAIFGSSFFWLFPDSEFTYCTHPYSPSDNHYKRVRICTSVIEAGGLSRKDTANAYYYRGRGHQAKERFDAAFADYTKSIRLNPSHAKAHLNRGNIHHDKGRGRCAIADYERASNLSPEWYGPYNNIGNMLNSLGYFDRAIETYNTAIKLDSAADKPYYNRGNTHWNKGQHVKALADYDKAISLNPEYVKALINRGGLYLALGQLDEAEADIRIALDIAPRSRWAKVNMRHIQICRKKPESRQCNRCGKWPDSPGCIGTRPHTPQKISMAELECG